MRRILLMIYTVFIRRLAEYGFIRNKTFNAKGKKIVFHDIGGNTLLKNIMANGFESHENEVVKLIKNYKWNMSNFYDIGANIGYYSIIVSIYHESTSVFAIEPFPLNVEYINKIRKNNNLNFKIINKAVDKEDNKKIDFYFPVDKSSSRLAATGSLINSFKGTSGVFKDLSYKTISVETISLDSLISNSNEQSLVKMDCEGNELNILRHSSVLDADNIDFIVEIMINDLDKSNIFNFMSEHGYNGYLITNGGLVREDRALTLPRVDRSDRTQWRNHFFTKKPTSEIKQFSIDNYGYWI